MYKHQKLVLKTDREETSKTLEACKLQSTKLEIPKADSNRSIEKTNQPSQIAATTNQAPQTTKTLEAAGCKLQETPNADSNPSIEKTNKPSQFTATTNQVPQTLTISECSVKFKLVSKNNHKTPILSKVPETESLPEDFETTPKASKHANVNKNHKNNYAPDKVATTDNQAPKIPNTDKVDSKVISQNNKKPPQASAIEKQGPEASKPNKPDPKTTCTCKTLQSKEAPAPVVIPKRQEPQNVPKYRWIAVKCDSLKTEAEKMAEIRLLLPKTETSNGPQTTTHRRQKPRLCPFCWGKVLKARQQAIERKERELTLAQQKEKKSKGKTKKAGPKENTNSLNNRFGCLLDEESA